MLKPAVLAIVLMAAWRIGRRTLHTPLLVALAITGFLALAAFKLPYPVVVIAAGLVGLLAVRLCPSLLLAPRPHGSAAAAANEETDRPDVLHDDHTDSQDHARFSRGRLALTLLIWAMPLVLPLMARFFSRVALLSFGGPMPCCPRWPRGRWSSSAGSRHRRCSTDWP